MFSQSRLCVIDLKNNTVNCSALIPCRRVSECISEFTGLAYNEFFLVKNGKKPNLNEDVDGLIHFIPRLVGGKGGFGSMLRAIGAQIEKTTNREACRDLSGRRLRDINEEQRLKNWITQQAERDREAAELKKKKLERLCQEPKHDFKDEVYEKERTELAEKVSSSVEEGLKKASTSHVLASKRPSTNTITTRTKKRKLWIDADDLSSSDDEDDSPVSSETKAIS